ncbi:hypothetical protein [Streptomyces sp. NPDC096351]|uniref:hypothetical protein n=1 Tax=Streptomyces sp. NPDC096351 TaxID=3366087 RepID=UPI0038142D6C
MTQDHAGGIDGLVFDRLVSGGYVRREALEGLVVAALREAQGPRHRANHPAASAASVD